MKKFIFLLLLLPLTLLAQRQIPEDVTLQKVYFAYETADTYHCGPTPLLLSFTKKRIYLDFYHGIYDMDIVRRKRNTWYAVREYEDKEEEFIIATNIIRGKQVLMVIGEKELIVFSNENFCK